MKKMILDYDKYHKALNRNTSEIIHKTDLDTQFKKAIEESKELSNELNKCLNADYLTTKDTYKLLEEYADVCNVMDTIIALIQTKTFKDFSWENYLYFSRLQKQNRTLERFKYYMDGIMFKD